MKRIDTDPAAIAAAALEFRCQSRPRESRFSRRNFVKRSGVLIVAFSAARVGGRSRPRARHSFGPGNQRSWQPAARLVDCHWGRRDA